MLQFLVLIEHSPCPATAGRRGRRFCHFGPETSGVGRKRPARRNEVKEGNGKWVWRVYYVSNPLILYLYSIMKETIKEAQRAEKAMNQALKTKKSLKQKKGPTTPPVSVVAEKI